ncbi:hypothetical protein EDB85DRAFT_201062 [Lactarius pseudohatsudake]|nr:hypothetical protein EDB85DRAFT_201062 [Lactarius pseudohatsudake]
MSPQRSPSPSVGMVKCGYHDHVVHTFLQILGTVTYDGFYSPEGRGFPDIAGRHSGTSSGRPSSGLRREPRVPRALTRPLQVMVQTLAATLSRPSLDRMHSRRPGSWNARRLMSQRTGTYVRQIRQTSCLQKIIPDIRKCCRNICRLVSE